MITLVRELTPQNVENIYIKETLAHWYYHCAFKFHSLLIFVPKFLDVAVYGNSIVARNTVSDVYSCAYTKEYVPLLRRRELHRQREIRMINNIIPIWNGTTVDER
jgi:hypothetical protein